MKKRIQVDIVLPVYNEAASIERVLDEWDKILTRHVSYRFIICEDGSTDGTKIILKRIGRRYPMVIDQKVKRRGYGGAVIDGIKRSIAPYVLCVDSDGQCDPMDFPSFWQMRSTDTVLIGRRMKRADAPQRKVFSNLFKIVFQFLFPSSIHDPSTPFVLFSPTLIRPHLADLRFLKEGFWWGFVAMCVKRRIPIRELPVKHRPRISGTTNVYMLKSIGDIAVRNLLGLIKLKLA